MGAVLLVLAAGAGVVDVRRRPGRRVLAVSSVIALLAGGLLAFETWERHRPSGASTVDTDVYDRPGTDRDVWLPLTAARYEVTALALLEIEPDADPVYSGFEPQFIDREGSAVTASSPTGTTGTRTSTMTSPSVTTTISAAPSRARG